MVQLMQKLQYNKFHFQFIFILIITKKLPVKYYNIWFILYLNWTNNIKSAFFDIYAYAFIINYSKFIQ